jgi:hypothetical protein
MEGSYHAYVSTTFTIRPPINSAANDNQEAEA